MKIPFSYPLGSGVPLPRRLGESLMPKILPARPGCTHLPQRMTASRYRRPRLLRRARDILWRAA